MRILRNLLVITVGSFCSIQAVLADTYRMPNSGNDIVGRSYTVKIQNHDSITTIRERNNVSYEELVEANPGINFNKPRVGQTVIIPKEVILPKYRQGVVINVPELRLYYFTPDGQYVKTYPVGLGRENWRTPIAQATIVEKEANPDWMVPKSIHDYVLTHKGIDLPARVPPGPHNPLGRYALHLSKEGYMIHGTDQPDSVGMFISSGCMRLSSESIKALFNDVSIGTPVHIIHNPVKAGWSGNTLYIECHKPVSGYAAKPRSALNEFGIESAVNGAISRRAANVNWGAAAQAASRHDGLPEPIGKAS